MTYDDPSIDYDPALGRFTQPDPAGQEANHGVWWLAIGNGAPVKP